jgi:hypothetical protein
MTQKRELARALPLQLSVLRVRRKALRPSIVELRMLTDCLSAPLIPTEGLTAMRIVPDRPALEPQLHRLIAAAVTTALVR